MRLTSFESSLLMIHSRNIHPIHSLAVFTIGIISFDEHRLRCKEIAILQHPFNTPYHPPSHRLILGFSIDLQVENSDFQLNQVRFQADVESIQF